MNNPEKPDRFAKAMEHWQRLKATGLVRDPLAQMEWAWSLSPLRGGSEALRFQARLENRLAARELAQSVWEASQPVHAPVAPGQGISLGLEVESQRPVLIDASLLVRHLLVQGSSGSGKTTFLAWIVSQLMNRVRLIEFVDHKGEGRRLLNVHPDVAVFRPDQEPWNMLAPVGTPEVYWSGWAAECARAYNLRPETWTELPAILSRVAAGRRPGDPYPSLADFQAILTRLAARESKPKLVTAAQALANLASVLGPTARIRQAPDIQGRYRLIVYEYQGLPPRLHTFLSAVRLLRRQLETTSEGHHA
jgi:hypothetical protein